jgi:hypothetical protein
MQADDAAHAPAEDLASVIDNLITDACQMEDQRDAALARVAELGKVEAALFAVTNATENMHDKALDLYWLGRRNIEEATNGPGGPAIGRIMQEHEEEAEKIANGDAWEHGFWAGTLTFLKGKSPNCLVAAAVSSMQV